MNFGPSTIIIHYLFLQRVNKKEPFSFEQDQTVCTLTDKLKTVQGKEMEPRTPRWWRCSTQRSDTTPTVGKG